MNNATYRITATGTSNPMPTQGGITTVGLRGTFGGTSAKLQWCEKPSGIDADWFDALDSSDSVLTFTTQKQKQVTVGVGYFRLVLTGGTGIALELVVAGTLGEAAQPG